MVVRQHRSIARKPSKWPYIAVTGVGIVLVGLVSLWSGRDWLTYKGVPLNIILEFVQDPIARDAYFKGDRRALHERLGEMGIEQKIKDYYRVQIPDERQLDRYIHQLMYDNTGYIGNDYIVDAQGQLALKSPMPKGFWHWLGLARRLGLASDHKTENGVLYIITPEGNRVPYSIISDLYSIADMKKLRSASQNP